MKKLLKSFLTSEVLASATVYISSPPRWYRWAQDLAVLAGLPLCQALVHTTSAITPKVASIVIPIPAPTIPPRLLWPVPTSAVAISLGQPWSRASWTPPAPQGNPNVESPHVKHPGHPKPSLLQLSCLRCQAHTGDRGDVPTQGYTFKAGRGGCFA